MFDARYGFLLAALVGGLSWPAGASAQDPEALMKRSGCFKCHAVDRTKLGPAYQEVAAKYRGNADAGQRLYLHLTTGPVIRIDGQEERHMAMPKATEAEVRAVAAWILSR